MARLLWRFALVVLLVVLAPTAWRRARDSLPVQARAGLYALAGRAKAEYVRAAAAWIERPFAASCVSQVGPPLNVLVVARYRGHN